MDIVNNELDPVFEFSNSLQNNSYQQQGILKKKELPVARMAIGSEKMIQYFQEQELSASCLSPQYKKNKKQSLNQSDIEHQQDQLNKSQNEHLFSQDPFLLFAQKLYSRLNEDHEKEAFIQLLQHKSTDKEFMQKLQLKPRIPNEKWVIPKATITPKNNKNFDQSSFEQHTERSLILQQKVNSFKQSQNSNDDSYLLQQSVEAKQQENVKNILESNKQFEQLFECEESLNSKIVFEPSQIQLKNYFQNIVTSDDIIRVSEEIIQGQILDAIKKANQDKFQAINPGFESIDEYLNEILDVIEKTCIPYFLKNINVSKQNDDLKKLNFFRQNYILEKGNKIYIETSNSLLPENFIEVFKMDNEIEKYYIKLLLDNFTEALEYFRPFDIRGKGLPWKINDKKLTFSVIDQTNYQIVFEQAKNKVIENSSYFCGFLNERRIFAPPVVDEVFVDQIRDEKLEKMIQNDVIEQNEVWIDYENDECIFALQISELIYEDLINELVQELQF